MIASALVKECFGESIFSLLSTQDLRFKPRSRELQNIAGRLDPQDCKGGNREDIWLHLLLVVAISRLC